MTSKRDFTILDTGPCLNFMGTGHTDILLGVLEHVSATVLVPEDVADEVRHKSVEIPVYTRASRGVHGAERRGRITIAPSRSGIDDGLDRWVSKLWGFPHAQIPYREKDLGEKMAVAHGAALQERGHTVFIVVNDQGGANLAHSHGLDTINTVAILRKAARLGIIADRTEMRKVFGKMRPHDGALRKLPEEPPQLFSPELVYGDQARQLVDIIKISG